MLEHQPAAQRKLEEVKGQIAESCASARRPRSRSRTGKAKLEQLRKGEDAGVKWSAPRA